MSTLQHTQTTEQAATVLTAYGAVAATRKDRDDEGAPALPVDAWLGVPYAEPPVGELRWRPPQPPRPWKGVLQACAFGPDTVQAANPRLRGSGQGEDVLHLSIWAPAGAKPQSLPVMVWLHGGGFVGGGSSDIRSDGAELARKGVVLVAPNYRTGIFGWLAHPGLSRETEKSVSGNWGLLDQIFALQWIRDNIGRFGGNPNQVTVFGVSAGSACISLLLTSPLAVGLFHRAILHSPGAGRPLATLDQAQQAGAALGADIEALRALDVQTLASLTPRLNPAIRGLTTPRVLRPICDGYVLPRQERAALLGAELHPMPMIVGSNLDEGTLLTKSWPIKNLKDWQDLVQRNFGDWTTQALQHYRAERDEEVAVAVASLFADTQFNLGARMLAQAMSGLGQPVWRYVFTRRRSAQVDGPHHGEEVAHAFGNLKSSYGESYDAIDRQLSQTMMQAWISFARDSVPSLPPGCVWPSYHARTDEHLFLGDSLERSSYWRKTSLNFLDAYYAHCLN